MTTKFSTPDAVKALAMDVRGVAPLEVVPAAFILQASTIGGFVEGDAVTVRCPVVSLEDQPGFVDEGADIPESTPEQSEILINTGKLAILTAASRESLAQPDASALLSEAMRRAVIRKANRAFLAQAAPTPPATHPPAGILAQTHTVSAESIETDLDALASAIATIEEAGGTPTHVLASPSSWAYVSTLKTQTGGNESLVGAGTAAPQRQLSGLPVLVDRDVPDLKLVVLDKAGVLSVVGNIMVAQSADYLFGNDAVALRVTWRFGASIVDPGLVVELGVGVAS